MQGPIINARIEVPGLRDGSISEGRGAVFLTKVAGDILIRI